MEYCFGDLTKLFRTIHRSDNVNRAEYEKLFSTYLEFLDMGANDAKIKFREGRYEEWQNITKKYDEKYSYMRSDIDLKSFHRSLNDLKH